MTTDYTGRKVDLFIFQGADYTGVDSRITLSFGPPNSITSGIQKAIQKWLILFLTRKGTVLGDAEFGTDFMTKLLNRHIQDEIEIQQEFAVAARDIKDYVDANTTTAVPDDEYITSAALAQGWGLTRTKLNLRIELTTRAGTTYNVVAPVGIAII